MADRTLLIIPVESKQASKKASKQESKQARKKERKKGRKEERKEENRKSKISCAQITTASIFNNCTVVKWKQKKTYFPLGSYIPSTLNLVLPPHPFDFGFFLSSPLYAHSITSNHVCFL